MGLDAELIEHFAQTQYACSKLEPVSGGMMNFTFRAQLLHPLSDGNKTVIIKHGEEYASGVPGLHVPTSRCVVEQKMLRLLGNPQFQPDIHQQIFVQSPLLYDFDLKKSRQVMEDITNGERLRDAARTMDPSTAMVVGQVLGKWLASFHDWTDSHADKDLLEILEPNETLDDAIHQGYDVKILGHCGGDGPKILDMVRNQLNMADGDGRGVIYGDLTTKNILAQRLTGSQIRLAPIDLEACRVGFRMQDIAVLLTDLFTQHYFENCKAALPMIEGFCRGYGTVKDTLIFQASIYSGLYLFLWEGAGPYDCKEGQEAGLLKIATDLVKAGFLKDQQFLTQSFLGCLVSASIEPQN